MNKPTVSTLKYYDWYECQKYLEDKYPAKDWRDVRIHIMESNNCGNDSYARVWPEYDDEYSGYVNPDMREMLLLLTEEFGERNEENEILDEPMCFWISW